MHRQVIRWRSIRALSYVRYYQSDQPIVLRHVNSRLSEWCRILEESSDHRKVIQRPNWTEDEVGQIVEIHQRLHTYKSLALDWSFCLEMTTTPSSLRLADSATTDTSPTGCPNKLLIETSTEGFCGVIVNGLARVTTTGTAFYTMKFPFQFPPSARRRDERTLLSERCLYTLVR